MSKVQRVPRELLASLGIVGANPPQELLDEYRATLETINFVISEIPMELAFAVDAAAVAGTAVTVTVPAGEVWFVESVSATMSAAADDNELSVTWNSVVLAQKTFIDGQTKVPGAQNQICAWAAANAGWPIIAKAGQPFEARCVNTDAAAAQTLIVGVTRRVVTV